MSAPSILVIEDDSSIREAVVLVLREVGYTVVEAADGQAGLDLLEQSPVSLIILDMRMPIVNGWEFAQALHEREMRIPVLVMTAASSAQRWAEEIQADGVLAKPFGLSDLLSQVQRLAGGTDQLPS
jgi:two-component system, chemotaxis family, chemotaxis protein CheY